MLLEEKHKYPFKKLYNCNCINLQDGKLAPCPLPFTIGYYNKKFNKKYNYSLNVIDIYDEKLSSRIIKEKLLVPFELCNYCGHYRDDLPFFKWEQRINNYCQDDWVYKKER